MIGNKSVGNNCNESKTFAIDIDVKNSLLYIAGDRRVTVRNLKLKKISSFQLNSDDIPTKYTHIHGIKVDEFICYITMEGSYQIYVIHRENGFLHRWGKEGSNYGEFLSTPYSPAGLNINSKNLFICDSSNARVQLLNKKNRCLCSTMGWK